MYLQAITRCGATKNMGNYLSNYTPWRTITISEKLYDCNGAIGRPPVMLINIFRYRVAHILPTYSGEPALMNRYSCSYNIKPMPSVWCIDILNIIHKYVESVVDSVFQYDQKNSILGQLSDHQ